MASLTRITYDGTYETYLQIVNIAMIDPAVICNATDFVLNQPIVINGLVYLVGATYPWYEPQHKDQETYSLSKPQHPLLNPESKHYEMIGGVQAIELMESMFTVEELKAWAKLTAMKYRLRIGGKDAPEKEIAKIKTFEAYWRYLDARK